jgi:hypothetical protein
VFLWTHPWSARIIWDSSSLPFWLVFFFLLLFLFWKWGLLTKITQPYNWVLNFFAGILLILNLFIGGTIWNEEYVKFSEVKQTIILSRHAQPLSSSQKRSVKECWGARHYCRSQKCTVWLDTVAQACNPSYLGGRDWEDCCSRSIPGKSSWDPISTSGWVCDDSVVQVDPGIKQHAVWKVTESKKGRGHAKVVEDLPSKQEVLSSTYSTIRKKKKKYNIQVIISSPRFLIKISKSIECRKLMWYNYLASCLNHRYPCKDLIKCLMIVIYL